MINNKWKKSTYVHPSSSTALPISGKIPNSKKTQSIYITSEIIITYVN